MKHGLVSMDHAGRIVPPKEVRQNSAIKPGDTFKITIEGPSIMLTPNKPITGSVRKGKALVFTTAGPETLCQETVEAILQSGRAERDVRIVEGLSLRRGRG